MRVANIADVRDGKFETRNPKSETNPKTTSSPLPSPPKEESVDLATVSPQEEPWNLWPRCIQNALRLPDQSPPNVNESTKLPVPALLSHSALEGNAQTP